MLSKQVDENIELRLHSKLYDEELCSVVKNNLEHLGKWLIWATKDYSIEDAHTFIESSRKEFAETDLPGLFIFYNDKLVGGIGCVRHDLLNKSVEIGYWLDKDHTGKGIIIKSCKVLIDYIFSDLKFKRVIIRCETENEKSQAIPKKLGFTEEGIARQTAKKHDKFVDLVIYSILKEEWK